MGRTSTHLKVFFEFFVLFAAIRLAEPILFELGFYNQLEIHPFWILVLLGAIQYGVFGGLITVLLACIFMRWPPRALGADISEYYVELVSQPLFWLIVALFVGSYRSLQLRKLRESERQLTHYAKANALLADELSSMEAALFRMELEHATQTEPTQAHAGGFSRLLELFKRGQLIGEVADAFVLTSKAITNLPARLFLLDRDGHQNSSASSDDGEVLDLPEALVEAVTSRSFAGTFPANMIFPDSGGSLSAVAVRQVDTADLTGIVVLLAETAEQAEAAHPITEILARAVSHALCPQEKLVQHRSNGAAEAKNKDAFASRFLKF